jgi:hypothetical protein
MKLKYFLDAEGKKIYTLAENKNNQPTKEAHYKFIKLRDAPPSNPDIVRKR